MTDHFDLKVSMLASGSSGNVTYIESAQKKILVDAGLSGKKIEQLLASIDRSAADLDAILVTHEHIDHIRGLGVLARKYGISLYANALTWQEIDKADGKIDTAQKFIFPENSCLTLGDLDIESYDVSHDAISPQFYAFNKGKSKFVMLTDTGYVRQGLRDQLKNASVYLMESNHDVDLLRAGRYPWSTKQRILGDKGHLSNEDGALALSEMVGDATKRVYLGHLSKENNLKPLAKQTNEAILKQMDCGVNDRFTLHDTDPNEATSLYTLG